MFGFLIICGAVRGILHLLFLNCVHFIFLLLCLLKANAHGINATGSNRTDAAREKLRCCVLNRKSADYFSPIAKQPDSLSTCPLGLSFSVSCIYLS